MNTLTDIPTPLLDLPQLSQYSSILFKQWGSMMCVCWSMTWFQNMNPNHIVYFMIMIQFTRRCWLESWHHPAVINILFPQERGTIVVDFSSAISELSIISKGWLYAMLLWRPTV